MNNNTRKNARLSAGRSFVCVRFVSVILYEKNLRFAEDIINVLTYYSDGYILIFEVLIFDILMIDNA
jgi:hypothetical protein